MSTKTPPIRTDFDRLQRVKEGQIDQSQLSEPVDTYRGRGAGKTFAACHDVAGAILVGDKPVVIMEVKKLEDIRWITPMLCGVLEEHGLGFAQSTFDKLFSNGKALKFVTPDTFADVVCGLDANFVSFIDY